MIVQTLRLSKMKEDLIITNIIQGRCIALPEACWRLFGNEIQKLIYSVQKKLKKLHSFLANFEE